MAYFIVVCCIPIAVLAGLMARTRLGNIAEAYVLIISGAIFLGIAGLWLSSLFESRSRGVGLIGTFGLYLIVALMVEALHSPFPGFAAISPLAGFIPLFHKNAEFGLPGIFGRPVPWVVLSMLLYLTLGAWLVVTLLRTLTRDYEEMRLLSRWQTVGCAAFLNFITYVLYLRGSLGRDRFIEFMVALSGVILFVMGLAMLRSSERLRVWWRSRATMRWALFSEDGPQWPWLTVSAAMGYGLLVLGLFAWKSDLGFGAAALIAGLVEFAVVLVFVARDITFLQWCLLTRMRAPVLKGVLFLGLYYLAATVTGATIGVYSATRAGVVYSLLTPAGAFQTLPFLERYLGIAIQVAMVVLLEMAIIARLRRNWGR